MIIKPQIKNPTTKLISWILIGAMLCLSFSSSSQKKITLPAGTEVVVELVQAIDSKTALKDTKIIYRVKYNVTIDGKVVIPAGSEAYGKIINCSKAAALGKPGYLEINVEEVKAKDGTIIPLSSVNIAKEGKSNKGLAIGLAVGGFFVLTIWSAFFLLIKGKNVKIESQTKITANVLYDTEINVE